MYSDWHKRLYPLKISNNIFELSIKQEVFLLTVKYKSNGHILSQNDVRKIVTQSNNENLVTIKLSTMVTTSRFPPSFLSYSQPSFSI